MRHRGKVRQYIFLQNISLSHEPLAFREPIRFVYVQYALAFMMTDIKLLNVNIQKPVKNVKYFRAASDIPQQRFFENMKKFK